MTWEQWAIHNVTLNAEAWRERDKGQWQKRIHEEYRKKKQRVWLDKAEATPRDSYGMKGTGV